MGARVASNSAISRRIEAIEAEAAKKAAKQEAVVDWGKLSDATLAEIESCCAESGELDYSKLSDAALEEIKAAF